MCVGAQPPRFEAGAGARAQVLGAVVVEIIVAAREIGVERIEVAGLRTTKQKGVTCGTKAVQGADIGGL